MDPWRMCAILFFVTTILFAVGSVREHEAGQEALWLASHDQERAAQLAGQLNQCVQDKQYAAMLDRELVTARNARQPLPASHS